MKISRECIACLARQAVEIAEEASDNKADQEAIIKNSLMTLSQMNFDETAPEIAYKMHQHAKVITGNRDPYFQLKKDYNAIAQKIADQIDDEKWLEKAEDPFDLACRLSIAGNIIDFSVGLDLKPSDIMASVEDSLEKSLYGQGSKALKEAASKADHILFLADNAGEIIFDKFLINHLPKEKITYVVKGGPIVNDATMDDALSSGLTDLVRVIDNGHDAQGTLLNDCSKKFMEAFEKSDLIISKGQANFETLSHIKDKEIFYLLRAKCLSVAEEIGCEKMDYVLSRL